MQIFAVGITEYNCLDPELAMLRWRHISCYYNLAKSATFLRYQKSFTK